MDIANERNRERMKILVLTSCLDLKYQLGCTPFWWQFYKSLYEEGNELVVVPYLGRAVESLWWETYENPCLHESRLMNWITERKSPGKDNSEGSLISEKMIQRATKNWTVPKWKNKIDQIIKEEGKFDACLIMNIPLSQFGGVSNHIKKKMDCPLIYYDGDMPTILPEHANERGFKFNYYKNADLSSYDAFLVNSEGIMGRLEEMGARKVYPFHYAVDPDLIFPVEMEKNRDISFYAHGSQYREEWMRKMITEPSERMTDTKFVVGGKDFEIDLGRSKLVGVVPIPRYKYFVSRSKINLNITRKTHASTYKTSTGRIFELLAMGTVMVSQPYNGLGEFFEPGEEYIQLEEGDDIESIYGNLLDDPERRRKISENARERILSSHTYRHRARQFEDILNKIE